MGALGPEVRRLLDEQRLAYVASVNADGTPNLSPKGTLAAWDDDHVVFADLASPTTVANLRARPAAEVNVVDPLSRKGYRLRGTAEVIEGGPEWPPLLDFFARRGVSDARRRVRAVVRIRVDRVRSVISPAYDSGMTESDLRERWRRHYERLGRGEPVDDPESGR